jgi:hypothetical protein
LTKKNVYFGIVSEDFFAKNGIGPLATYICYVDKENGDLYEFRSSTPQPTTLESA